VGIGCRLVMAGLSGMGLEHQHSRDALTGHGRLERRAPAVWNSARRSLGDFTKLLPKVLRLQLHLKRSSQVAQQPEHGAYPRHALSSDDPRQDRALASDAQELHPARKLLPAERSKPRSAFVADYNHLRYHESISNLTPADVYFGRGQAILIERERIKRQTIANRRLLHRRQAA